MKLSVLRVILRLMARIGGILLTLFLAGCAVPQAVREPVSWSELPGWSEDSHAAALPVFLRSCPRLDEQWTEACMAAKLLPTSVNDVTARAFFESHFLPHRQQNADGGEEGLMTGYYEPLLEASLARSSRFRYPLYGRPEDLLTVDLESLYPELKNKRVRGRVLDGRVIPYYTRAEIDGDLSPLSGNELFWVEDRDALFFLHIQGSGLVRLRDGTMIGVGYLDQNGHPYRSIGRLLVKRGEMEVSDVNLFSLREWLKNNPRDATVLLNENPSYVFFTRREDAGAGPKGALGVELTAERSLAVDKTELPLGAPVWLSTVMPDDSQTPLQRLMVAQDTGGAIRGGVRADVFWGRGARAEKMAGLMKHRGQLFVLLPRGFSR